MKNQITKSIHEAIVAMRARGMTQEEIAGAIGVDRSAVAYDLLGRRKTPHRSDDVAALEILTSAAKRAANNVQAANAMVAELLANVGVKETV